MRNFSFFLTAFVFSLTLQSQIIDIPDANFKAALIDIGVDTNNDGEIQVSEAEARTGLNVNNQSISSLEGIEYFINLTSLSCRLNNLTTLDLSSLINLNYLTCDNNQLSELNLNGVNNLVFLHCYSNMLTELSVNSNTNMNSLLCGENNLTQLDVSSLTNLDELSCRYNQLTNIDITNLTNLIYFDCSYNDLNSIDFSSQSYFQSFNCSGNNLTSLDLTSLEYVGILQAIQNQLTTINLCEITDYLYVYNNSLTELDLSNSPYLQEVLCSNNLLTSLDISNNPIVHSLYVNNNELVSLNLGSGEFLAWTTDVLIDSNPNLSVVCTSEDNFNEVQILLDQNNYTDCTISSYCSFEPNGEYYIVQGQTLFDANNDGCDVTDNPAPNLEYSITNNSINDSFISYTNGEFSLYIDSGSHTITPELENPTYFTVSPTSITVDFPTDASPYIQDFCVTANGIYHDLEVTILPLEAARPGFDTDYKIMYKNKGTTTLSGSVELGFQSDIMDFVMASPTIDASSTSLLTWNFSDLMPLEVREIVFTMNINSPMENPPVNGDDILIYDCFITILQDDETPEDNFFSLNQTVVNSFDPNDKTCLQGNVINPAMVGEYVHYMIRFENTGTANAINVVVKDVIDTAKLDLSTLVPLRASHNFFARIENNAGDHYVEFIFEDINLPFDDANNDGFVIFKIRTLDTLQVGDTFENNAEIYFDFNYPIITNTTQTSVQTLSIAEESFDNNLIVHPNPSSEVATIVTAFPIEAITLYDATGRLVKEIKLLGTATTFQLITKNLAKGNYFVKVVSNDKTAVRKLIVL